MPQWCCAPMVVLHYPVPLLTLCPICSVPQMYVLQTTCPFGLVPSFLDPKISCRYVDWISCHFLIFFWQSEPIKSTNVNRERFGRILVTGDTRRTRLSNFQNLSRHSWYRAKLNNLWWCQQMIVPELTRFRSDYCTALDFILRNYFQELLMWSWSTSL